MKAFIFFLFAFLAVSNASSIKIQQLPAMEIDDKSASSSVVDAIATLACVEKALDMLNKDIAAIQGGIGNLQNGIAQFPADIEACKAKEGKPGLIKFIKRVDCMGHTTVDFKNSMEGTVQSIVIAANGLIHAKGDLDKCFQ